MLYPLSYEGLRPTSYLPGDMPGRPGVPGVVPAAELEPCRRWWATSRRAGPGKAPTLGEEADHPHVGPDRAAALLRAAGWTQRSTELTILDTRGPGASTVKLTFSSRLVALGDQIGS